MDNIELEIAELQARFAAEDTERAQGHEAARLERMKGHRERMRSGAYRPRHVCADCLKGLLTLDPSLVCEAGRHSDQWWL